MPGLARGIARTAVVAGTATAVSGRVARRQASKYTEQDAQLAADRDAAYQRDMGYNEPPPPPQYAPQPQYAQPQYAPAPAPAPAEDPMFAKLQQLADLHASGVLTDDEFSAAKAKVLAA
jgi:hypothetical protein